MYVNFNKKLGDSGQVDFFPTKPVRGIQLALFSNQESFIGLKFYLRDKNPMMDHFGVFEPTQR